jgi:hypothetical protein
MYPEIRTITFDVVEQIVHVEYFDPDTGLTHEKEYGVRHFEGLAQTVVDQALDLLIDPNVAY